jgi:DEAD/DEAH box helicase domain-containing protein
LHEILGKPPYIPSEKKEKNLSDSKASMQNHERKDTENALNRVRRQLKRETIKQEHSVEQGKKEKAFIVTDKTRGMIGVISALLHKRLQQKYFIKNSGEKAR